MSRLIIFVPSNFTVDPELNIDSLFKDCRFYSKDLLGWVEDNIYKDHFGRYDSLIGYDIVTEDSVAVFKSKLKQYTGKREESSL
ncbi:hypothetical protein [Peribacillus asahii]|uniref:hypothetical protein n=1 Tax=Peribacillus asahii TaxID=228899 RepID=UPI00381E1460